MHVAEHSIPLAKARGLNASAASLLCALACAWAWAIWSCAEDWRFNPQYAFGWFVPILAAYFAVRRWQRFSPTDGQPASAGLGNSRYQTWGFAVLALGIFPLELMRQELYASKIAIWTICLGTVALTIWLAGRTGGNPLRRVILFPSMFFLSAVPWPSFLENRMTVGLKTFVAAIVAEGLHWWGIPAKVQGAVIEMHAGLVGIDEACSGIRSLQTGLMVALAVGEYFFLNTRRRTLLTGLGLILALVTNLIRTFTLCLLAESQGMNGVDRHHDLVGAMAIIALPALIWVAGKILARPRDGVPASTISGRSDTKANAGAAGVGKEPMWTWTTPGWERVPDFRPFLIVGLIGFLACHTWFWVLELRERPQSSPSFAVKTTPGAGFEFVPVSSEVLRLLRPTSGEYIRRTPTSTAPPLLAVDCYHFFWRPSARNNFVLVHRPDVCMPAGGWHLEGPVERVTAEMNQQPLDWYAFRFRQGAIHAFVVWGVWRNGEPVMLDYNRSVFQSGFASPWSILKRKPRPGLEIVCCIVAGQDTDVSLGQATETLRAAFDYRSAKPARERGQIRLIR